MLNPLNPHPFHECLAGECTHLVRAKWQSFAVVTHGIDNIESTTGSKKTLLCRKSRDLWQCALSSTQNSIAFKRGILSISHSQHTAYTHLTGFLPWLPGQARINPAPEQAPIWRLSRKVGTLDASVLSLPCKKSIAFKRRMLSISHSTPAHQTSPWHHLLFKWGHLTLQYFITSGMLTSATVTLPHLWMLILV